jgi:thiamine biosynthesis protein ThiS
MWTELPHANPEPALTYEISFTMNLHINGEERSFADPGPATNFTLSALIESLEMKSDRVAVELNRDIVPRDRWPQTHLKDGDRLEIVHFVGGGCPSNPPTHSSS